MNLSDEGIFAVVSCFLLYTFFIFVILYVVNYDNFTLFFSKTWNGLKKFVFLKKAKLDPSVKTEIKKRIALRKKMLAPCAKAKGLTKSKFQYFGVKAMIKYSPCATCLNGTWYHQRNGRIQCQCSVWLKTTVCHGLEDSQFDVCDCSNYSDIRDFIK